MSETVTERTIDGVQASGPLPGPIVPDVEDTATSRRGRAAVSVRHFFATQRLGVVSLIIIVVMCLASAFAGIVATKDPTTQHRDDFFASPSTEFLLGTDDLGRDMFSRILFGARATLFVAFVVVVVATIFGTLIGIVSGYLGGRTDLIVQRIVDAFMSIPVLILALFIVALLGAGIRNVVLALCVIYVPRFARIARGEILRVRETDYVAAANALGAKPWRVMTRHGVPNILAPIIIMASLTLSQAIIAEAALSFLGLGAAQRPDPSLGGMLADAQPWAQIAWWQVVFPGAAIAVAVLAFNLLGDALRDHFDPKLVR